MIKFKFAVPSSLLFTPEMKTGKANNSKNHVRDNRRFVNHDKQVNDIL